MDEAASTTDCLGYVDPFSNLYDHATCPLNLQQYRTYPQIAFEASPKIKAFFFLVNPNRAKTCLLQGAFGEAHSPAGGGAVVEARLRRDQYTGWVQCTGISRSQYILRCTGWNHQDPAQINT